MNLAFRKYELTDITRKYRIEEDYFSFLELTTKNLAFKTTN